MFFSCSVSAWKKEGKRGGGGERGKVEPTSKRRRPAPLPKEPTTEERRIAELEAENGALRRDLVVAQEQAAVRRWPELTAEMRFALDQKAEQFANHPAVRKVLLASTPRPEDGSSEGLLSSQYDDATLVRVFFLIHHAELVAAEQRAKDAHRRLQQADVEVRRLRAIEKEHAENCTKRAAALAAAQEACLTQQREIEGMRRERAALLMRDDERDGRIFAETMRRAADERLQAQLTAHRQAHLDLLTALAGAGGGAESEQVRDAAVAAAERMRLAFFVA
jgi:hypothetical protein